MCRKSGTQHKVNSKIKISVTMKEINTYSREEEDHLYTAIRCYDIKVDCDRYK